MYLLGVSVMFAHSVIVISYICQASHAALAMGTLDFSFANLAQAAFCKYWSQAPDFCTKIIATFLIFFYTPREAKQNKVFRDF